MKLLANKKFLKVFSSLMLAVGTVFLFYAVPTESKENELPGLAALHQQASELLRDGNLVGARSAYRKIVNDYPEAEHIDRYIQDLEAINMKILTGAVETPEAVTYKVQSGDTLGKLAKKFSTTVDLIRMRNKIKNDTITLGQKLSIWSVPLQLYVDKSQNILFLKAGKTILKTYPVSTGKQETTTPTGEFTIVNKLVDPVWYHKGRAIPPGTPENHLGTRWMGFDIPSFGIHGTVEPDKIGQSVSSGCVRMRNEDVEELYKLVPQGAKVVIVN